MTAAATRSYSLLLAADGGIPLPDRWEFDNEDRPALGGGRFHWDEFNVTVRIEPSGLRTVMAIPGQEADPAFLARLAKSRAM